MKKSLINLLGWARGHYIEISCDGSASIEYHGDGTIVYGDTLYLTLLKAYGEWE